MRSVVKIIWRTLLNKFVPTSEVFINLQRSGETCDLRECRGEHARSRINVVNEKILNLVEEGPTISTRKWNVSQTKVRRTSHENQSYPLHMQHVQVLQLGDHPCIVHFCEWLLQQHTGWKFCKKNSIWTSQRLQEMESSVSEMSMFVLKKTFKQSRVPISNKDFPWMCVWEFWMGCLDQWVVCIWNFYRITSLRY